MCAGDSHGRDWPRISSQTAKWEMEKLRFGTSPPVSAEQLQERTWGIMLVPLGGGYAVG